MTKLLGVGVCCGKDGFSWRICFTHEHSSRGSGSLHSIERLL